MRYSRQREMIINILKGRKDHPSANAVYASAIQIDPKISLGTVYRNLKQLSESGQIETVKTDEKIIHYDGDTSLHSHFVCKKCGRILDVFFPFVPDNRLTEKGFVVSDEKCVYYGICPDCNKNTLI